MLWPSLRGTAWNWDPWSELRRLQRSVSRLDRLFEGGVPAQSAGFPALNVWRGKDGVLVTAELPGIDPKALDVSVRGSSLVLRGARQPDELKEGETYHRRERGFGEFVRSLELPHRIDADKVEARYVNGILRLKLPYAAEDKPRQVTVEVK